MSLQHLYELKFSRKDLKSLPRHHAGFLVMTSLAGNEILTITRALLSAHNSHQECPDDGILLQYTYCQSRVLARLLSSKIYEYLSLIEQHEKRCARRADAIGLAVHEHWREATREIRNSTAYKTAELLRNKLTNHYVLESGIKAVESFQEEPSSSIFLHEKDGNTGNFLGEEVAILASVESLGGVVERLNEWEDWVIDTSRTITNFHSDYLKFLLETFFPEKTLLRREVSPPAPLVGVPSKTTLPVLWDLSGVPSRRGILG